MKLHNTLTRKTEDFKPQNDDVVKLYTCGPTVYDYAHIGNLRSFVFDDTLRRALEASGYKVQHVMNITDVGHLDSDADEGADKLEKGAQRENKSVWDVANLYKKAFEDDMRKLNVLPPNGYQGPNGPYARATDFIEQQIEIIKILIDKGFGYVTEQAVYFDTLKLSDYGKLTGQKLSDKEVAARPEVVTDSNKKHPQDFALWFFKTGRFASHSMSWDSPWGEGFPGWHLECSAIIHATLGEPIDIHTGGVDHIGTHHTNEIAQTEAAFDVELSRFWVHNEHLLVEGEKMAKSKGNFVTLKDITDKGYDPLALRMLFLLSHYRSQTNFTWESLDAAQIRLANLYAWADLVHQHQVVRETMQASAEDYLPEIENDLATYNVIMHIELNAGKAPHQDLLEKAEQILGLGLTRRPDISDDQKRLIAEREEARSAKNWTRSDELRQKLLEQGIEINDTQIGPIWRRV
jgi:cysteinyl-tRNA synthetase